MAVKLVAYRQKHARKKMRFDKDLNTVASDGSGCSNDGDYIAAGTGFSDEILYLFSSSSGMLTFASTLTISTTSLTPLGTYTITVIGTDSSGSLSRSCTYTLTSNT